MSLHVCILTPSHWAAVMGGSQYQAQLLTEYLVEHCDVRVTYLTTRRNPSFTPEGYEIVQFSSPTGIRRYGFFFDAVRLFRALRRVRPDVIVQFVGCAHTGIAAGYARFHGCRMVWRVSSDRSVEPDDSAWWQLHRRIERRFLEFGIHKAELVLAQTRYQRDALIERFGCRNVELVGNFHPVPADVEHKPAARRKVVWVANLKPLKNPSAFLRLAARFAGREDVEFVMIGRALADDDWTRATLREIDAAPNVAYLGELPQAEVNAALERADLLVSTSVVEGFANTFIQAWMRRVPVVSLHVDPDGLLGAGRLGAVSGTESQLVRDVARLLDSAELRTAVGARCREYAVKHHGESNIARLARLLDVPPAPTLCVRSA